MGIGFSLDSLLERWFATEGYRVRADFDGYVREVIWQGGEFSYFSYGFRKGRESCVHGLTHLLTYISTHIEIFCFTHPPLLLGKFLQRGSAIPTPCFNTAFSDLYVS